MFRLAAVCAVVLCFIHPFRAHSQVPPTLPLPQLPPKLPEQPRRELPPPLEIPPTPPPTPRQPERPPAPAIRVFIQTIQLVGNTKFTEEQLAEVTNRYTNRALSMADMEALRQELTLYYVNRGYLTSGAVIPDQKITFYVLRVDIIEGQLSEIDVRGTQWLWSGYVRNRLLPDTEPPLNVTALEDRLKLLQRDRQIAKLNAELAPGEVRGQSILNVQVKEARLIHGRLDFNNFQSPTVGAEQGLVTLEDQNLTGLGDSLSVQYGRSEGVNPILNIRYALPITARDTTVSGYYRRFTLLVTEAPFDVLQIENKAEIIGGSVRHPLYRTLSDEVALSFIADYETNKSFILGEPFELIAGATNGVFRIAALRFAQEWVHRTTREVLSVFSRFSVGIGALGTTPSSANPQSADARFFSWLGEAQWVRQLELWRMQVLVKTTMQLSNDHLFPLEQFAVGGRYSVRGYREFTFVRDNGVLATVELRVPILTIKGLDRLHVAPFVDVGRAWNTTVPTGEPDTLASVGAGLIGTIIEGIHFEVYWGQQLNHLRLGDDDLQDHGVHFQVVVQAF
jgi:hemolysin activation/secretion protein